MGRITLDLVRGDERNVIPHSPGHIATVGGPTFTHTSQYVGLVPKLSHVGT